MRAMNRCKFQLKICGGELTIIENSLQDLLDTTQALPRRARMTVQVFVHFLKRAADKYLMLLVVSSGRWERIRDDKV